MTLEKQLNDLRFTVRVALFLIAALIVVQLWVLSQISPLFDTSFVMFVLIVPVVLILIIYACSNLNLITPQTKPIEQ